MLVRVGSRAVLTARSTSPRGLGFLHRLERLESSLRHNELLHVNHFSPADIEFTIRNFSGLLLIEVRLYANLLPARLGPSALTFGVV